MARKQVRSAHSSRSLLVHPEWSGPGGLRRVPLTPFRAEGVPDHPGNIATAVRAQRRLRGANCCLHGVYTLLPSVATSHLDRSARPTIGVPGDVHACSGFKQGTHKSKVRWRTSLVAAVDLEVDRVMQGCPPGHSRVVDVGSLLKKKSQNLDLVVFHSGHER